MIRKPPLLLAGLTVAGALGLWFGCQGCASPPAPELRRVTLGPVEDVLEGPGDAAQLAGGLPAVFLVGDAGHVELLLAARRAGAADEGEAGAPRVATLVDASTLDDLQRTALVDRLTEAALDEGGPILVDATGATARSLRDGAPGPFRVEVDAASRVTAIHPLSGQ